MWYLIVSIPDLCTLTYFVNREMLLSDIMSCGSQCYQRQYRRQGTKLDRYWGITKHRKERSLGRRMLLVTLQHDLTSTLDSGVQTDMIVLEFSKAFDRVPNIQFTWEATPRWHQGIPNSRSNISFLAEPSVVVESCSSESVCGGVGGGVLYVSVLEPLLFLLFILYVPDTPNTSRRVFSITLSAH